MQYRWQILLVFFKKSSIILGLYLLLKAICSIDLSSLEKLEVLNGVCIRLLLFTELNSVQFSFRWEIEEFQEEFEISLICKMKQVKFFWKWGDMNFTFIFNPYSFKQISTALSQINCKWKHWLGFLSIQSSKYWFQLSWDSI